MTPRFTLVIPTHNRGHLLELALRSVLAQDFDDFEVFVSDDQSTDRTPEVATSFRDPRIRHVRTPRRLSMADHFEWASQLGAGQYLMFLCDDDAVSPELLSRVDQVARDTRVEVVALKSAVYFPPDSWRVPDRNTLEATAYSGRIIECDSRGMLREMLGRFRNSFTPRGNNSFAARRLVETIRSRTGRFFLSPAPDASSSCLLLAHTRIYVLLDEPLHIFGQAPESIGADQESRRSAASTEFAQAAGRLFELSPVRTYCVTNIIAESYLQARRLLPEAIPPLDLTQLYLRCLGDLDLLGRNGVDVRRDRAELETWAASLHGAQLARQGDRLRQMIAFSRVGPLLRKIRHAITPPPIKMDHRARLIRIHGDAGAFANIAECAARLPKLRSLLVTRQT
jgi:glycosyltransferase involved in cell wall biosynthesis